MGGCFSAIEAVWFSAVGDGQLDRSSADDDDGRHLQGTNIKDLPEHIIIHIMSNLSLSLRDVVSFSLASKQWVHIPACVHSVITDTRMASDDVCPQNKDPFIKVVDQFMQRLSKLRAMLPQPVSQRNFAVFFCFTTHQYTHLDRWISMAIHYGFTGLVIHPVCGHHYSTTFRREEEKYIFPWQMIRSTHAKLKGLSLRSGILGCSLASSRWIFLDTLELLDTTVTAGDMDNMFYCFPNLKRLYLSYCIVPAKLTFASAALNSLAVVFCPNVEEIDLIGATALMEFIYNGMHIDLHRIRAPRLTYLTFSFLDVNGEVYVIQNLRPDTLRSLTIFRESERAVESCLHGRTSPFPHLEEIKLYNHPASFQTMIEILKACPVLKRLEMVPTCTMDAENVFASPVQYLHECLRLIHIRGFCRSKGNVEVAKFLVQVKDGLQYVIVEP